MDEPDDFNPLEWGDGEYQQDNGLDGEDYDYDQDWDESNALINEIAANHEMLPIDDDPEEMELYSMSQNMFGLSIGGNDEGGFENGFSAEEQIARAARKQISINMIERRLKPPSSKTPNEDMNMCHKLKKANDKLSQIKDDVTAETPRRSKCISEYLEKDIDDDSQERDPFDGGVEHFQMRYLIYPPGPSDSMMAEIITKLNFIDETNKLLKSQLNILDKLLETTEDDTLPKDSKPASTEVEGFPSSRFLREYSLNLTLAKLKSTLSSAEKCSEDASRVRDKVEKRVKFSMRLMEKARNSMNCNKVLLEKYAQKSAEHQNSIVRAGKKILSMESRLDIEEYETGRDKYEIANLEKDLEMIKCLKSMLIK